MSDDKKPDDREELLRLREENLRLREERLNGQTPIKYTPPPPKPTVVNVTQKNEGCLAGCGSLVGVVLLFFFVVSQCSHH